MCVSKDIFGTYYFYRKETLWMRKLRKILETSAEKISPEFLTKLRLPETNKNRTTTYPFSTLSVAHLFELFPEQPSAKTQNYPSPNTPHIVCKCPIYPATRGLRHNTIRESRLDRTTMRCGVAVWGGRGRPPIGGPGAAPVPVARDYLISRSNAP